MEAVDLLLQGDGGGAERFDAGGGGGHFDEVVVAEVMDGIEARTGLICRGSLLRGGDGDLSDHLVDAFRHSDDALERFAGLGCGDDTLLDGTGAALHAGDGDASAVLDLLDHGCDLACGLRGAFGEAADFTGYDREASAVIAGAGSLDGCVEREQVGLTGDLVDDGDDLADALGVVAEQAHRGRSFADRSGDGVHGAENMFDDLSAFAGCLGSAAGCLRGGLRVTRDLGDGGRHLLHGRGCLLGLLTLLVDAAVDLVGGRAHGGGATGERACGIDHGADDGAEAALHLLHGRSQGAYLVLAVEMVELFAGKVSFGDGVGAFCDEVNRFRNAPGKHDRDKSTDECARIVAIQSV